MVFYTTFDFQVRLALGLGLAALVVSFGLVLPVLVMRLRGQRRERERAEVQGRWRPLLLQAALSGPDSAALPALPRRELADVLLLKIQLQDSLRGSAHDGLNVLAMRLGFAQQKFRPPAGEYYARVEAPRGDMGFYVVSDGSEYPYRVRIRTGSYTAMSIIDKLSKGIMVADLIALIGSLDVDAPEIDR